MLEGRREEEEEKEKKGGKKERKEEALSVFSAPFGVSFTMRAHPTSP